MFDEILGGEQAAECHAWHITILAGVNAGITHVQHRPVSQLFVDKTLAGCQDGLGGEETNGLSSHCGTRKNGSFGGGHREGSVPEFSIGGKLKFVHRADISGRNDGPATF